MLRDKCDKENGRISNKLALLVEYGVENGV